MTTATKTTPKAISPRVKRMKTWTAAQELGRSVAGYEKTSPIYGKTDLEVLTQVRSDLTAVPPLPASAAALVEELLRRKTARAIAGQNYHSAK